MTTAEKKRAYYLAHREEAKANAKRWAAANPEKRRAIARKAGRKNVRKNRYGISLPVFYAMLQQQGGCCAACSVTLEAESRFTHVDHCHKTGRVRGLLCLHCNAALGYLKDDAQKIKGLLRYLETQS